MLLLLCFGLLLLVGANGASPSTPFKNAKIIKNSVECVGIRAMSIEVDDSIATAFTTPGQYVQMKLGEGKPGFYAIASPPDGRNVLSFLIKESESNQFLTKLVENKDVVEMSVPQGKGFQYAEYFDKYKYEFPTTNVLLMACGSGLAPIASAIDSNSLGLNSVSYNSLYPRKAKLYLGVKSSKHIPYQHKFKEWEQKGVTVIPSLSQPEDTWKGCVGYIQDALARDTVATPKNSAALLCGQRGMTDAVKKLLLEVGVFEGRILTNF